MDYFHYDYQCPYITSTNADRVVCENGSRVVCPTLALARRYVKNYCSDENKWQECTIAQMLMESESTKMKLKEGINKWQKKNVSSPKKN